MKLELKTVFGDLIFEGDFPSMKELVLAAVAAKKSLSSANLSSANLSSANLRSANLSFADLSSANLSSANLRKLYAVRTILPEGDLIGYKQLRGGTICKLRIPADAKRVGGLVGRKCRAQFAVVLEGEGISMHDPQFKYTVGQTVKPTGEFNDSLVSECESGIHFFITRQEAEDYNG